MPSRREARLHWVSDEWCWPLSTCQKGQKDHAFDRTNSDVLSLVSSHSLHLESKWKHSKQWGIFLLCSETSCRSSVLDTERLKARLYWLQCCATLITYYTLPKRLKRMHYATELIVVLCVYWSFAIPTFALSKIIRHVDQWGCFWCSGSWCHHLGSWMRKEVL